MRHKARLSVVALNGSMRRFCGVRCGDSVVFDAVNFAGSMELKPSVGRTRCAGQIVVFSAHRAAHQYLAHQSISASANAANVRAYVEYRLTGLKQAVKRQTMAG